MAGAADNLTLGWQVTAGGDPTYWLTPKPRAGKQSDQDLVAVPAGVMAAHTVIVAQSGSGKSFFLGRIVEELLLHTKARCVIFDPNSDFRKIHEVQDAKLWTTAKYDLETRLGRLPHETHRKDFATPWLKMPMHVLTASAQTIDGSDHYERLQVWWPDLNADVLSEDLNPLERSQVYHCHSFVRSIARLVNLKQRSTKKTLDVLDIAERLHSTGDQLTSVIRTEFNVDDLAKAAAVEDFSTIFGMISPIIVQLLTEEQKLRIVTGAAERWIDQALSAIPYVSPAIGRFYFGKAREYKAFQILADKPQGLAQQRKLDVIDLPSIPDRSTRLLVINVIMTQTWRRAREAWAAALEHSQEEDERVPTFIVVDEAHNLVSADPQSEPERALRDQFRMVAAEGRKFGLFLILVSQRPDKLDPLVVSECENKAVMRMDSRAVLDGVVRLCGLEDIRPRLLEKCLEFGMGRVLLAGRWAGENPRICFSAARRTAEGGRNLRVNYWASPEELKLPLAGRRQTK